MKSYIAYAAPLIASRFSLDVSKIAVDPESIEIYYRQARKNAKVHGEPWDKSAAAKIIRSQVSDPETYDKLSHRLDSYEVVSFSIPIFCSRFPLFFLCVFVPLIASSRLQLLAQKKRQ